MIDLQDFELKKYEVNNLPAAAYYVAEFISAAEERELMRRVYSAPRPKWTQLAHRRLQNWGGLPTARGMLAERLPAWLQGVTERVAAACGALLPAPNHVLVNEYLPAQGILPHADGALFHPVIATLSAGSHTVLRFSTPRSDDETVGAGAGAGAGEVGALLLEARSLVVITERLYTAHLHGIEPLASDTVPGAEEGAGAGEGEGGALPLANLPLCARPPPPGRCLQRGTRLSFTIRHVPRTTTFKLNIGNKT